MKGPEEEKEGINLLQAEINNRLSSLRRAENLRRRCKTKEQGRSNFFKDPFKFVKSLFTKNKSGKLKTAMEDLKAYLNTTRTASGLVRQLFHSICHQYIPLNISWTSVLPSGSGEDCTLGKSCILSWAQWSPVPAL